MLFYAKIGIEIYELDTRFQHDIEIGKAFDDVLNLKKDEEKEDDDGTPEVKDRQSIQSLGNDTAEKDTKAKTTTEDLDPFAAPKDIFEDKQVETVDPNACTTVALVKEGPLYDNKHLE